MPTKKPGTGTGKSPETSPTTEPTTPKTPKERSETSYETEKDQSKVFAEAAIQSLAVQEQIAKVRKEIESSMGNSLKLAQEKLDAERFALGELEKLLTSEKELSTAQIARRDKLIALAKKEFDISVGEGKNAKISLEKLREKRALQEIENDLLTRTETQTEKIAKNMGMTSNFSKTTTGQLTKMVLEASKVGSGKAIGAIVAGLAQSLNLANIAANALTILYDEFMKINSAAVELRVSTGFAKDFETDIIEVSAAMADFGIKTDEVATAFKEVYKTITNINNASGDLAKNLANSAAKMTKLGVSANTTVKNQNLLLKSFQMGGGQIVNFLEDMAANAENVGLTAESMGSQFATSMEYLASFGSEGVKAFKDLAAQAAVTGLAVSELMNMTKAFDKFGEGAKKAATLNAVLGTSISSMAMMNMNAAERSKELRTQLRMATGGVNNLTQAQKLFVAEQLYSGNVAKMMADLNASPAEIEARARAAERRANMQQRLADAMEKLVPLQDKLTLAFEKFVKNESAMKTMGYAIEGMFAVLTYIVENIGLVSTSFTIIHLGMKQMAADTIKISNATRAGGLGIIGLGVALFSLAEHLGADGYVLIGIKTLAMGMTLLGVASQFGGGKLYYIAAAFTILYGILSSVINPPFIQFGFFLAAGILAMGIAAQIGGMKLVLLALAFGVLFGAVALVIYGISAVIDSITGLFTVLIASADVLPLLAMNMYLLGGAFLFLGASALYGSMGIFMGLAGLTAMLLLFKLTGTSMKDMFGAGDEILKIGTGIAKFGQGLNNIKSAISEIKSSVGDKGIFAASISGDTSSIVMGEGAAVAKLFKNSKIEIDVNMPEISIPEVKVKVFIGNEELRDIIRKEITRGQR